MHPMPREGTETDVLELHKQLKPMHPMPREGTETLLSARRLRMRLMHPMPREGTETLTFGSFSRAISNASYAP